MGIRGTLAAVALLATTLTPHHASALTLGCTVEQHETGSTTCVYVAATAQGYLTATVFSGSVYVVVQCRLSTASASRSTDGTTFFSQLPGEVCQVNAHVLSGTGGVRAEGGSVVL